AGPGLHFLSGLVQIHGVQRGPPVLPLPALWMPAGRGELRCTETTSPFAHLNEMTLRPLGPPAVRGRMIMANDEMLKQMSAKPGFIAALDQSGGSTPGARRAYGIADTA